MYQTKYTTFDLWNTDQKTHFTLHAELLRTWLELAAIEAWIERGQLGGANSSSGCDIPASAVRRSDSGDLAV